LCLLSLSMMLVWMAAVGGVTVMCWWSVTVTSACEHAHCSHLCLPTVHFPGFTCACPSDRGITYSLASDGQTCRSTLGEHLFLHCHWMCSQLTQLLFIGHYFRPVFGRCSCELFFVIISQLWNTEIYYLLVHICMLVTLISWLSQGSYRSPADRQL